MLKTMDKMIIALFVLAIVSGSIIQIIPAYQNKREAERMLREKKFKLEQVRAEYRSAMQEIHDLEHSPAAIEKVAREKFKYCRPGEKIYLYTE